MTSIDIGVDAARVLARPGPGRVRAVFSQALYLDVPGGLLALCSNRVPRGPLHLRLRALPEVPAGCPVLVSRGFIEIGGHVYSSTGPVWPPRLPPASMLRRVHRELLDCLPGIGPTLALGPTGHTGVPDDAVDALRRGDLPTFADLVGGRGPGLTPAGDDMLAGVLLTASALAARTRAASLVLRRCADRARTNAISHAFLACAAQGRCIDPAHALLEALANADRGAARLAVDELRQFGSSSGVALAYGIRTALAELPSRLGTPAWPVHAI
jgi:hypothetical protein